MEIKPKVSIVTNYDPVINRYRSAVIKEDGGAGEVLYIVVRAKREAAEWIARQYVAYQL